MNLTLDDLFEICHACKGTGKKEDESETASKHGYGQRPVSALGSDNADCDACQGYGRGKLTETGQALLDFMRVVKRRGMI